MEPEKDKECPICQDKFLSPRYLPCGHTFCEPCLRRFLKKSKNSRFIVCPLCRKETKWPENGVFGLLQNFFVSVRKPRVNEVQRCNLCSKEKCVRQCSHCGEKFCRTCQVSHQLALESQSRATHESGSEDEDDSDTDTNDDTPLPLNLLISPSPVRTKFSARIVSSFNVNCSGHSPYNREQDTVHCICTTGTKNLAFVLPNLLGEIITYDKRGKENNRIDFEHSLSYLARCKDGSLLVTSCLVSAVFHITDYGFRSIDMSENYRPTCLSVLDEGYFVVSSICIKATVSEPGAMKLEDHGAVQIYDLHGNIQMEIKKDKDGFVFVFPGNIAVNPNDFGKFCVSDRRKGCVFFFQADGDLTATYKGNRFQWDLFGGDNFVPTGMTFDPDGNLIVINSANDTLHVIRPNGEFVGYILARDPLEIGQPISIAIDEQGYIWLGDVSDGKVRICEITSYKNFFHNPYRDSSRHS